MNLKRILIGLLIITQFTLAYGADPAVSYKLYGFVRNDFYFNSRKNQEGLDGLFNIFPYPENIKNDKDLNATPNAEMLAISTRLGLDLTGPMVFGAKSSAKIECDFAGISSAYYLIRIRQAYSKLNWSKNELLVGQTWHPMFANLQPITPALSVATPFNAFNRSPQVRFKHAFNNKLSLTAAAIYQMQFLTQGPNGASASYMKEGLLPSGFIGLDYISKNVSTGIGLDAKSLKIGDIRLNSGAAVAYARYSSGKFQVSAKSTIGQNMSELLIPGGYGASAYTGAVVTDYTNINTSTSWLSLSYGSKVQVALYGGYLQNLGTNNNLAASDGKYTYYGYGAYATSNTTSSSAQIQLDKLYRIAPSISYTQANVKLALEYELTTASYGTMQANGRVSNPYNVNNHRVMGAVTYSF